MPPVAHRKTTHLHDLLQVDSTSPSGLRWKQSPGAGRSAGDVAGRRLPGGYYEVQVLKQRHYCHQLVLELSGYPCPGDDFIVDHCDSNPSNNCLGNLRWVTRGANIRRARRAPGKHPKYVRANSDSRFGYEFVLNKHHFCKGGFSTPAKAHTAALAHRLELFWSY